MKLGGAFPNCYEPGTSRPVTNYGRNTSDWGQIEGIWNSGNRIVSSQGAPGPRERRLQGTVYVKSLSVREIIPGRDDGPEILKRSSMEYQLNIPQARAYAFDTIVDAAERNGVFLKLVVMEKGDEIYLKTEDDGEFVTVS